MHNPGRILRVKFLLYAHWFMSISISQMKYHSILVDKARYATSILAKYLDTSTVKTSTKFYKTTLPSDIIFSKDDSSTSYDKVLSLSLSLFDRPP